MRVATGRPIQTENSLKALPQRIRAGCDCTFRKIFKSNLSLPQRIRAGCDRTAYLLFQTSRSLPQRIRAGCDIAKLMLNSLYGLCHSAFVRVATQHSAQCYLSLDFATAHSCGLRRKLQHLAILQLSFATAHSCGLRRRWGPKSQAGFDFATAHSCGLRRFIALIRK